MEKVKKVKYGGRKKGTPNRLTKEIRLILKDSIFREISSLEKNLEKLDPKTRIELLVKLLPFICPKIKNESYRIDEPLTFNLILLLLYL